MKTKKSKSPNNDTPRSLPWLKFTKRMDLESRLYWVLACSAAYAKRWWEGIPKTEWPTILANHPGDAVDPFRRVQMSPGDFIDSTSEALEMLVENTIVSFVTTFEVYLLEVTQRALYLKPELLGESSIQFTASELTKPEVQADFRSWFSKAAAARITRNRTHEQAITYLNTTLKLGFVLKGNEYDPRVLEWRLWELLRNSIVHAARSASDDLVSSWNSRFSTVGAKLRLVPADVTAVSSLARSLAASIDRRFMSETVKTADDDLLVRELFARLGLDEPHIITQRVRGMTRSRISRERVESLIAQQRKSEAPVVGYDFGGLLDFE